MASDWRYLQLKDVIDLVADNRGRNPESYSSKGIPVIDNYLIISEGYINLNEVKRYIDESTYENFIRKHIQENDVLVTLVGNGYGQVALTPSAKCVIIQNTIGLRCNSSHDNVFLYYLLKNNRKALMNLNIGAAQPSIKVGDLTNLEFQFPPLPEQKAIAHILGSLDDKIELNRQMNETLEAMAQALFKSWFVDFDPVIDNALAAGNAIPDEMLKRAEQRKGIEKKDNADIQGLFPDEFEFTEEMGWIPKEWQVTPVYEVAEFINGSSFKSQYFSDENEGLPIIKIAEIKNGVSQQTNFTTQKMPEKYFIDDGSILFSWSGNPDTSIDTFIWTGGEGWLNQHIFNVVLHKNSDRTFVYYLLKMLKPVFTEIARDKQTTGLGHVTVKDMKRTYTIKPSSSILEAFTRQVDPIFEKWYQNLFSSRELTKLRDTLLPKLMSGELRIPDAAELVGEAII